jgi:hypothetical protein
VVPAFLNNLAASRGVVEPVIGITWITMLLLERVFFVAFGTFFLYALIHNAIHGDLLRVAIDVLLVGVAAYVLSRIGLRGPARHPTPWASGERRRR